MIRQDMGLEQASARLKLEGELSISHEAIHHYFCTAKLAGVIGGNLCAIRNRNASTMQSRARV